MHSGGVNTYISPHILLSVCRQRSAVEPADIELPLAEGAAVHGGEEAVAVAWRGGRVSGEDHSIT